MFSNYRGGLVGLFLRLRRIFWKTSAHLNCMHRGIPFNSQSECSIPHFTTKLAILYIILSFSSCVSSGRRISASNMLLQSFGFSPISTPDLWRRKGSETIQQNNGLFSSAAYQAANSSRLFCLSSTNARGSGAVSRRGRASFAIGGKGGSGVSPGNGSMFFVVQAG